MFTKTQKILAAILVVQIFLVAFIYFPRNSATPEPVALLGDLTTNQIAKMAISDVSGNQIVLEKKDGAWVLPDIEDYVANLEKIQTALDSLIGMNSADIATETAASHVQLQVAETKFQRKVDITLTDGTMKTIYLGTSPNYQDTHVRIDGEDKVYLVKDLLASSFSPSAAGWVDTGFMALVESDVKSIIIQNKNGTFTFTQDSNSKWQFDGTLEEGMNYSDATITSLVSDVITMRMVEPVGKNIDTSYGFDQPAAVVTITSTDANGAAVKTTLILGAQDESGNYFARVNDQEYIVKVASYYGDEVTDFTETSFLVPESTPTAVQ
jgi:hypothetical protein